MAILTTVRATSRSPRSCGAGRASSLVALVLLATACAAPSRPTLAPAVVEVTSIVSPESEERGSTALLVPREIDLHPDSLLAGTAERVPAAASPLSTSALAVVRVIDSTDDAVLVLTPGLRRGWLSKEGSSLLRVTVSLELDLARMELTVGSEDGRTHRFAARVGERVPELDPDAYVTEFIALPSVAVTPWGGRLFTLAGSSIDEATLESGDGIFAIHPLAASDPPSPGSVGILPEDFDELVEIGVPLGAPLVVVGA